MTSGGSGLNGMGYRALNGTGVSVTSGGGGLNNTGYGSLNGTCLSVASGGGGLNGTGYGSLNGTGSSVTSGGRPTTNVAGLMNRLVFGKFTYSRGPFIHPLLLSSTIFQCFSTHELTSQPHSTADLDVDWSRFNYPGDDGRRWHVQSAINDILQ